MGIYIGLHDLLGVQDKARILPSLSYVSNLIIILNIPRSHNGSDAEGEIGEESEGKPTDTPYSRNGRCIAESWLE